MTELEFPQRNLSVTKVFAAGGAAQGTRLQCARYRQHAERYVEAGALRQSCV